MVFWKVKQTGTLLAILIKNKMERAQINKIRSGKRECTTDAMEIQKLIIDKWVYANEMDNLEEMDKFAEMYKLSRLSKEEIENMNIKITSTEIETMI